MFASHSGPWTVWESCIFGWEVLWLCHSGSDLWTDEEWRSTQSIHDSVWEQGQSLPSCVFHSFWSFQLLILLFCIPCRVSQSLFSSGMLMKVSDSVVLPAHPAFSLYMSEAFWYSLQASVVSFSAQTNWWTTHSLVDSCRMMRTNSWVGCMILELGTTFRFVQMLPLLKMVSWYLSVFPMNTSFSHRLTQLCSVWLKRKRSSSPRKRLVLLLFHGACQF